MHFNEKTKTLVSILRLLHTTSVMCSKRINIGRERQLNFIQQRKQHNRVGPTGGSIYLRLDDMCMYLSISSKYWGLFILRTDKYFYIIHVSKTSIFFIHNRHLIGQFNQG